MLDEVVESLNCSPGKIMADCTLGGAGHASAICSRIFPGGLFIGIDQDPAAIEHAKDKLKSFGPDVKLFCDNFSNLATILSGLGVAAADGIVVDLGLSLHQITGSGRGFSFNRDEPLDMRMDPSSETTAEELVNRMPKKELEQLFRTYGEERWSRAISERIVRERRREPIRTSARLAKIVAAVAAGKQKGRWQIHPATRVFMALRIAVNRELERLESFLEEVEALLAPGGRLSIISFHSLEDRLVKHRLKAYARGCTCPPEAPVCVCGGRPVFHLLTKKGLKPTAEEVARNPMARSARLRIAEKIGSPEPDRKNRGFA